MKIGVTLGYPSWGVTPPQGRTSCLVTILLCLVAKLLLTVPPLMLAYALWLSGEGVELTNW
jgi:hypothetical protein